MKLKVCGMRDPNNMFEVAGLKPDLMGFIFYPDSKRAVQVDALQKPLKSLDKSIQKVGVFVNHPLKEMLYICRTLKLDYAQLHGDESPAYLAGVRSAGVGVIKVFLIDSSFDWTQTEDFYDLADFFLFDTASNHYGGSGKRFNWQILSGYAGSKPFFLSGGIDLGDVSKIIALDHPQLTGIDVNSRFEREPAMKDIHKLQQLQNELQHACALSNR